MVYGLSVRPSVCLFCCWRVRLSVCLFIHLSVCLSVGAFFLTFGWTGWAWWVGDSYFTFHVRFEVRGLRFEV